MASTWLSLVGILGIGSWLGAILSAKLTSDREHRRWILDNKKAEWRELIDAIGACSHLLAIPESRSFDEAIFNVTKIFENRIFICTAVEDAKIRSLWIELKEAGKNSDEMIFYLKRDSLNEILMKTAKEDLRL